MSEEQQVDHLIIPPVFQYQCRLCHWSKEAPDLYNWVCQQVIQGFPYGRVASLLVVYLEENYPEIKSLTKKSIWNHFEKHVPPKEGHEIEVARQSYNESPHQKLLNETALEEIKALKDGNFDEHEELCKLYIKFREVHDQIYEMADSLKVGKDNGGDVWSQNKIQTFTSMINTQKAILAEIAKMRQSNKLISVATQYIVETFTKSIVSKLSEEFSSLLTIMKRHNVDESVLDAVEDITSSRLASILINEAEAAMGKTKQEFRLPN